MVTGIIGKKIGMTQLFSADGTVVPATVIKAGPCVVVQRKTKTTDGYDAVQIGFVDASTCSPTFGDSAPATTRTSRRTRVGGTPAFL